VKVILYSLLFSILLFDITGCGIANKVETIPNNNTLSQCESSKPVNVLFIGNSFTFYNDLPKLFKNIACSNGINIQYDSATIGGAKFVDHASNLDTLDKINLKKWDYVILQEQSQLASFKLKDIEVQSLPFAKDLVTKIKKNNELTEIIYYATWGKLNGDKINCSYYSKVCTFKGYTEAVEEGYSVYQKHTGGKIAFVGRAWGKTTNPSSLVKTDSLFDPDGSHPSLKGSYLAALVLVSTAFSKNLVDSNYPPEINKEEALFLQKIGN
jgi:hypothetical protein